MRIAPDHTLSPPAAGEVELTDAAVGTYARLLGCRGIRLTTHASGDGGLICEERSRRARPVLWRIAADGQVLPDRRYNFRLRTFVSAPLPEGV